MVYKNDEKARSLETIWRERPRRKREELVKNALLSEQGLLLQLKETEAALKDAVDVSANTPRLRQNIQKARNELERAEKVLQEAIAVMAESVIAKATLKLAFDDTREAWQQVPTFKRHQLWDTRLKKKVLKVLA